MEQTNKTGHPRDLRWSFLDGARISLHSSELGSLHSAFAKAGGVAFGVISITRSGSISVPPNRGSKRFSFVGVSNRFQGHTS